MRAIGDHECPKGIPDGACSITGDVTADGTLSDRHCAAIVVDATTLAVGVRRKERGIVRVYKTVADRHHCGAIRPAVENRAAISASGKVGELRVVLLMVNVALPFWPSVKMPPPLSPLLFLTVQLSTVVSLWSLKIPPPLK